MIRVEPTGHTVFPATAFDAQVQVMQALGAEGSVPVPEVLWFEQDPSVLGARFLCMARVDGDVPADNPGYHGEGWMTELDEAGQRARVGERPRHDGGDPPPRPRRHRPRLDRGRVARRAARSSTASTAPSRAATCPTPSSTRPSRSSRPPSRRPPTDPALCWGDSRIGNMIFGADQQVAAVLDWEMVTAGDPVQDLAWYLLLDRHHTMAFEVPRLPGLPAAGRVDRPLGGGQRPLGRSTSSGTSCSARPATPRSWCA